MAFTYTNIADDEIAASVRSKINALGGNAASLSSTVDTNTANIGTNTSAISTLNTNTTNAILQFTNKTVAVSDWVRDTTYTYYPYKANITCTGITANHKADVSLAPHDQESGHYIGCDTSTNTVTIYAVAIPSATLTIPNITAVKVVN